MNPGEPRVTTATAPGKIILLGEHAVVYTRPAIAAPVWQTVATATVRDASSGSGCVIVAHDLGETIHLAEQGDAHPLALVTRQIDQQAFTMAVTDLWLLSSALYGALALLVWWTRPRA